MATGLVLTFLLGYVLPAAIAGLLQWADARDSGIQLNMKDRIIKLYLLPLVPIGNWFIILFAFIEYLE